MTEYRYTTAALAAELGISPQTLRKRAARLNLGIDWQGRAGFRYSEADKARLLEDARPAPVAKRRKRRSVA